MSMISPQERKAKTEAHLKALGIRFITHLPCLEAADEIVLQNAQSVARRVLLLLQMTAVGHGQDRRKTIDWLRRENLFDSLSPDETKFLNAEEPTEKQIAQATWRLEAAVALLWALGRVRELGLPKEEAAAEEFITGVPLAGDDTAAFIESAHLRPIEEILDAADFTYRIHWMTRDEWVNGGENKLQLNDGIALERHWALNWLLGLGESWDDVDIST